MLSHILPILAQAGNVAETAKSFGSDLHFIDYSILLIYLAFVIG
ncbi:MAG: hypothetical protein JWO82_3231, partial [Akkermansiaceae bacterium]|nr:hypothetical protein [Akkermansiaceae bacterium]